VNGLNVSAKLLNENYRFGLFKKPIINPQVMSGPRLNVEVKMNREEIIQMARSDPKFAQVIEMIRSQIGDMEVTAEDLDEAIQMFELMLNQPDAYPEIREAAISDGVVDGEDLPEQYDPTIIISFLVVLYGLQDEMRAPPQMAMAKGGLAMAANAARSAGRYGDTQLVHMNRSELNELSQNWGKPTINPQTGMPEFFLKKVFKTIGKVLKIAAPIILSVVAPGLGTAIGAAMGLGGTAAAIAGGAILGGVTSGLTGGNVLKGALMGGVGGGLGKVAGGFANKSLGLGLGAGAQNVLGGAIVGGAAGAATGQGVLRGAGQGAIGGAIGNLAGGINAPNAFQQGVQTAGKTFGQALTAGYNPKEAAFAGATAGLMRGATYEPMPSPSTQVVDSLKTGQPLTPTDISQPSLDLINSPDLVTTNGAFGSGANLTGGAPMSPSELAAFVNSVPATTTGGVTVPTTTAPAAPAGVSAPAAPAGGLSVGNVAKYVGLAGAASSLFSAPKEVQEAVVQLNPQQQEYFNRPSVSFDWDKLQRDAAMSGMGLSQFMANNWNAVASGAYNVQKIMPTTQTTGMAQGGALNAVSRFARGAGSGRDDVIDAKLSDGEYVIDAETVALLGDGSSKEGARRLEEMRNKIRRHKGKTLAKGKFSPNAKSPLAYIKGAR
jgi:hypothetical protein